MKKLPESDTVPCPVCGSSLQKLLFEDTLGDDLPSFDYAFSPSHNRTYRIVRCLSCSHAFSIVPHKNLWENYQSVIDNEYLKRQDERLMTSVNVVKTLRKIASSGTLLDIGCATGDFLSVARNFYDVEGLELSAWSAHIAQERGFAIHTCTLSEMQGSGLYDIITLWGVVEHFESPRSEIGHISRLLKPGGIVCLWTGDIDSWIAKLLGKRWWYIQGQHIQFFSRKSLCRLFADYGFELASLEKYPFTTNYRSLNKSLRRYPVVNGISQRLFEHRLFADRNIHLSLPGEMYAVFRKKP